MQQGSYSLLSERDLLSLCVWREARGEPYVSKACVAHVVLNRVAHPCWWGDSIHTVILKPWQFSSFNPSDPNNAKWPEDNDPSWIDSQKAVDAVLSGSTDPTDGAQYYHDVTMKWPKAWGNQANYVNTLNINRLMFFRPILPNNHSAVQQAATGDA